jgi:hypothetical protein
MVTGVPADVIDPLLGLTTTQVPPTGVGAFAAERVKPTACAPGVLRVTVSCALLFVPPI